MTKRKKADKPGRIQPPSQRIGSANEFSPAFVTDDMKIVGEPTGAQWQRFFIDICKRTQMTWQELINASAKGLGIESIKKRQIKERHRRSIPAQYQDEERFIVMRMGRDARMVGARVNREFRALWLDTRLDLYDHGK